MNKLDGTLKIFNNRSIKSKLITAFIAIIALMFLVNIFSIYKSYTYNEKYRLLIDNTNKEGELKVIAKDMVELTGNMITNNNQQDLEKFNYNWIKVTQICDYLDKSIVSEESKLSYKILKNSLKNTKIDCNNAIIYNENSETALKSSEYYNTALITLQYLEDNNGELLGNEVSYMKIVQGQIDKDFNINLAFSIILLLILGLGCLGYSIRFSSKVSKKIIRLKGLAKEIADGDLVYKYKECQDCGNTKNELNVLEHTFMAMKKSLNFTISAVRESAVSVTKASEDLAVNMNQSKSANNIVIESINSVHEIASLQADSIGLTFYEIEAVQNIIQDTFIDVKILQELVKDANINTNAGKEIIDTMVKQMESVNNLISIFKSEDNTLNKNSLKIGKIVDIVTDITIQANILELNATKETVRVGESGNGVVILEGAKKLSEQSKSGAEEISKIIKDIQSGANKIYSEVEIGMKQIEDSNNLAEKLVSAFDDIYKDNEEINSTTSNVINYVEDVSNKIKYINEAMKSIYINTDILAKESQNSLSVTEEQLAVIEEVSNQAVYLEEMASDLIFTIERFKI